MHETFLEKVRRGLHNLSGNVTDIANRSAESEVARRVAKHFAELVKARVGLPADVSAYVASGGNTSVLSTVGGVPIQTAWRGRVRSYPPRDVGGLFAPGADWSAAQVRRLGEVLATLEPITFAWGFFGTKASPDWWRHAVTLWLGHDRKQLSLDWLTEVAAENELGIAAVLDIWLCRDAGTYGVNNSVARFSDGGAWLERNADAVIAVIGALAADERATLAAAIGRFGLVERFLEPLIDLAVASSKKARTAARQALTGADPIALTERLGDRYAKAATGVRAELIETAAAALGGRAHALLSDWREGATTARVLSALDRAMGAAGVEPGVQPEGVADGPDGYTAIDGSFVALPSRPPMPEASVIPNDAFGVLTPAAEAFNVKLAAGKVEAASEKQWHWARQFNPVGSSQFALMRKLGEGDHKIGNQQQTALGWIRHHDFRHPGVAAFFDHPGLTLRHAVRFALASCNGYFATIFNDWSGPAGAALAARIAKGADPRLVLDLWIAAGGRDPVYEHLTARWYQPIYGLDAALWPVLCDRFDLIDEALGLKPQSAADSMTARPALDLLALFPTVPRRYQQPLMLLASGSAASARAAARSLLRDAPAIDDAIARLLQDGRQDVRAGAADWLVQRAARDKVGALRTALKTERSEIGRAAMITALERLGDDVSDFFDDGAMLREAEIGIAKTGVKGLEWFPFDQLPALHWRDGTPLDPKLPRWWMTLANKLKQPAGTALIDLWLDRLVPSDAHALGWFVLNGWVEQDIRTCTVDEANAFAAGQVDATLQQHLSYMTRYPQSADYWSTDRAVIFEQLKRTKLGTYLGSAVDSKGVLALATRANGADAAQKVRNFLKDHGARTSQAKALLDMLASNPAGAALQVVLAAANRSKQRSVQAHAGGLVAAIAERRGWTTEELADRTIPSAGLDADGTLELECGRDRTYTLRLDEQDALALFNPEGKPVKALPTARIDEEKPLIDAAKKLMATARKEAKQVFAAQAARLREAMCVGRRWKVEDWESFLAGHPLVARLTQRLIWLGLDADGAIAGSFRPLGDGSYSDAADEPVEPSCFAEIALAHHSLIDAAAVAAWRQHLTDYEIAAPFDQIGRSLPVLNEADRILREIRDREGWMIETFKLRGAAAKLGYDRGGAGDGGWFTSYERAYRGIGIVAEIEFTGSPLPEQNVPAALIALNFRRVRSDGHPGAQIALGDVPPVLLVESWQDLHDMAAKGSGFDPDWQKKSNG